MKSKLTILALGIGLLIAACDAGTEEPDGLGPADDSSSPKSNLLTIYNGSHFAVGNIKWKDNVIKRDYDNSLSLGGYDSGVARVQSGSGYLYFTREGSSAINLRTRDEITVSGPTSFSLNEDTLVVDAANDKNTGSLMDIMPGAGTGANTLTIKNQSFSDLLNVEWQGTGFASNTIENSVTIGNTVTKTVQPGSGYIYFKRKSNPASARTKDIITIADGGTAEFTFTDNTLIVEAYNPDNTGTLKDMATTVVFFDNAEGEIQPYAERKSSAYYSKESDLPQYSGSNFQYYQPPYTGTGKSIAVGGDADSKLRLSLTLARRAKLSFRYANKSYDTTNIGAISIDGTQKASWTGDYNWSFLEYPLEAGTREIEWTKHGNVTANYSRRNSYLSLDDILVVYTE
jgi:hypothetical protein